MNYKLNVFLYLATIISVSSGKLVQIQRGSVDIFPGKNNDCSNANGFHYSKGKCKCNSDKGYFLSRDNEEPYCYSKQDIIEELQCSMLPTYITQEEINLLTKYITVSWTCGNAINLAHYWDYDDETKTGRWLTSSSLTKLTVKRQEGKRLKLNFDNRDWSGVIIKLTKQESWCTDCMVIKFQGKLNYPIEHFMPKLGNTTMPSTTTTTAQTNVSQSPTPLTTTTRTPTTTTTSTTTSTTTTTKTPTESNTTPITLSEKTTTQPLATTTTTTTAANDTEGTSIVDKQVSNESLVIGLGATAIVIFVIILLAVVLMRKRKSSDLDSNSTTITSSQIEEPVYAEFTSGSSSTTDIGETNKTNTYEPLEDCKSIKSPTLMQYQELNPKYQGITSVYTELNKPVDTEEPIYKELEPSTYEDPSNLGIDNKDYYSAVITPTPDDTDNDIYAQVEK